MNHVQERAARGGWHLFGRSAKKNMRAFPILVACGALVSGFTWISIVSKFRVMYDQLGVSPPHFTSTLVNTSGWIPGGISIALAIFLIALVILKQPKIAGIAAVTLFLFMVGTAVVLPRLLVAPLSGVISDSEAERRNQQAEQADADRPTAAPNSKPE